MSKIGSYLVCLVALIAMSSTVVIASEIQIEFAQKAGIPLAKSSVAVERAKGVKIDGDYRITGVLKVSYRLFKGGHLHVFAFDETGAMTSESKHRVPGLNSARKGVRRVPFNVLVSGLAESTTRILVEHHNAGHVEIL